MKAFLVTGEGALRRRVPIEGSLTIGRSDRCDLVLKDAAASREHLEIRATDSGYVCQDLGSRNGTLVNDREVVGCELAHGDRIVVGETTLRFEVGDAAHQPATGRTTFLQTILDQAGREQARPEPTRSKELLEAAYTLMNAIASNFEPCRLVDDILRTTMDAIRAQRGAILFVGPDGELEPCGVCDRVHTIRDGEARPASVDDIRISESVVRRVLRDGENVLYQGVNDNGTVDLSASITALKLTSILCVPIRTQNEILGILYVDTDVADHEYTHDDLLLAAAAGNSAGLALENARIHKVLLEKQRIEQEIAAAWTIQEGFLIKDWPADDRRFEVYGETRPARTVGGDFYDLIRLGPDSVGVLIGDVSGKGVAAALSMAQVLAEFRLCAHDGDSPAEVLARLNRRLVARSRRGTFCTMSFAVVDLATGGVVGASAGHHPALRLTGGESIPVLEASGPPAGVLPDVGWQDARLELEPGDTLMFYTDGLLEARSGATVAGPDIRPAEYGADRLRAAATERGGSAPRALVEGLLGDVQGYCAPLTPHDDCTMIALRYRGHGD